MGTYFNPNNESFREDQSGKIYVDKTMILSILNEKLSTPDKCISLSHARRFGKSQVAGMIDAYYSIGSDSRELFSKYKISKSDSFDEHLNKYNVIHIDMSSITDYVTDGVEKFIIERIKDEIKIKIKDEINYNQFFHLVLDEVYRVTGRQFVIIIDEWDCIVRNYSDNKELVHRYLQFLHSLFKSEESKSFLALAYITGILPIKKIENESALNNFKEYTMINSKNLTEYFGFTEDEVKNLCIEHNMEFETIKEWYDGYYINGKHMYNPNSVVQAMMDQEVESYWKNTSSFESINTFIDYNFDGLKEDIIKMLEGEKIFVDTSSFQNDVSIIRDRDEALTALIHLGYLGYDNETGEAFIPNYEVSTAFKSAIKTGNWGNISKIINRCDEILLATIRAQEEKVERILNEAHMEYTSVFKYNDENSLSCAITMSYFTAPAYYNVMRELPSGKGFADIAFIPRKDSKNKPAFIVELKYDKSADSAIKQIKEKRYDGALRGWGEEVLLVGINYDKDSKEHECRIEKVII